MSKTARLQVLVSCTAKRGEGGRGKRVRNTAKGGRGKWASNTVRVLISRSNAAKEEGGSACLL